MAIPLEAMGDERPNSPGYKSSAELAALSDVDLADYIAACDFDYDGTSQAVRVALARLLRRPTREAPHE